MKHSTAAVRSAAVIGAMTMLLLSGCANAATPVPAETPEDSSATTQPRAATEEQWDSLVDAAVVEGEVVVYVSTAAIEETFKKFEDQYPGITVVINRAPPADIITRLDQEIAVGAPGADVTMHSQLDWFTQHDQDSTLEPMMLSPENAEAGLVGHVDGRNHFEVTGTPFLIAVNTDSADPITDVEDLLDAPEDASMAVASPEITPAVAFQYQLWLDTFGDDFLSRIAERNVTVYPGNVPLAQDLAAGAHDYGFAVTPNTIGALEREGAPVKAELPDEARAGVISSAAVLANAPHPNAAQLFANWLISEEGGAAWVESHSPIAVPLDVDGAVPWDSLEYPDMSVWTNEYWDKWMADEWKPYFG